MKLFREAGAVIIAKTNVPQTMLSFECSNPVWGVTTNPYSSDHTSGGSTGGEGALLAMNGSAIGVGSDIGGSLRIPAGYCGIYSLKPTAGRITKVGARCEIGFSYTRCRMLMTFPGTFFVLSTFHLRMICSPQSWIRSNFGRIGSDGSVCEEKKLSSCAGSDRPLDPSRTSS